MSIIRPRLIVHVLACDPIPFTLDDLHLPPEQHVHLLQHGNQYTRCGQPQDTVNRAWGFATWTQTMHVHSDHCTQCWYGAERIMHASMRVK
jgi:hypothetical protein